MSQHIPGRSAAPAEWRLSQQSIEKLGVETLEYCLEIEELALRTGNEFTTADLFHEVRLATDIAAIEVQAIAMGINRSNGLAVEFAEEDVGQRLDDRRGRAGQ